jgi:hypothetical protein
MRNEVIQHLQGEALGTYTVSNELPWTENGTPLYSINPKVIYFDKDQTVQESVLQVLNGSDVVKTTITVTAFVINDAKTLPIDYESITQSIIDAKNTTLITETYNRECDITTSYLDDMLLTSATYRFTTII